VRLAPGDIDWLGRTTESCLASGAWMAAVGLVEHSVAEFQSRLGVAPRLLLHGGDAAPLAPRLRRPVAVVDGLVLSGLALWRRTPPVAGS
jgi:type III pantothenate kinase